MGDNGRHLIYAAREGRLSRVRELVLDDGANVKFQKVDLHRNTPLHMACQGSKLKAAKFLIENGADVNAKCKKGWTPLHLIGYYGQNDLEIAALLLDHGAYVGAKDTRGWTLMHWSCSNGRLEVFKLLII